MLCDGFVKTENISILLYNLKTVFLQLQAESSSLNLHTLVIFQLRCVTIKTSMVYVYCVQKMFSSPDTHHTALLQLTVAY